MEKQYTYKTTVNWIGEKKGNAQSDGLPRIDVATPPEFGGPEGRWSPEHLLVSSVASCVMTTFLAIAEASRFEFAAYESSAVGTLEQAGKGYEFTSVVVSVKLKVGDESAISRAERLLQKAEQNCFISNSLKAAVAVESEVVTI